MTSAVPQRLTFARGFTLVELALVLMIIALMIGGLLIPLTTQQENRTREETARRLNEIRDALIGYAVVNGRLPRPAKSATDGLERSSACGADTACTGFVPWSLLGTEKTDAWGKIFRYAVSAKFADAPFTLAEPGTRSVSTRDDSGAVVTLAEKMPAVIFSEGKERWGTTDSGVDLDDGDSPTNADEDANHFGLPAYTTYFSRSATTNKGGGGGEFDDILVWVPTTILANRMIAAGKLP